MKIGIVGIGIVGGAIKYGFEKLGHKIFTHDIAYNTKIENVLDTEICFICVPTPANEDGSCNISIVEDVVLSLNTLKYNGIIVIKSTVVPGTTESLSKKIEQEICFVPEFLRERCAVSDFMENHDICIIGTNNNSTFELIRNVHDRYPKMFVKLSPTEAEFCKYFNNVYNAMLIIFANSFYELCKKFNVDYTNIKNVMINKRHISDIYLDCNENIRGFGGICLPKDTKALAYLCKKNELDVDFFQMLLNENNKYRTTIYEGMRRE